MGKPDEAKRELSDALLSRFPDAPTKTLARKMWAEGGSRMFRSLENCREYLRMRRGNHGAQMRAEMTDRTFYRPNGKAGNPWGAIPAGMTHFEDWRAVDVPGPLRILSLYDAHIPYHDRRALVAALEYGRANKANVVHLGGDFIDMFSVSRWEKDPRKRNFKNELETTKQVLQSIRKGFPRARIIYQIGNHEERYESYMFAKAPELLDVKDFELHNLLDFAKLRVERVGDKRPIRFGKLNALHGHEWKSGFFAPVNPARTLYLKAKTHAICGHLHKASQHSEADLDGKTISCWSAACLCDLHPDYAPLNGWGHGFPFIEVDREGRFNTRNLRIVKGKVYE